MGYKQTRTVNTSVIEPPGLCHRLVREVYGVASHWKLQSAIDAWRATQHKGSGSHPLNVSVPVWFAVTGHNDGHVVAFVPGKGYLSTKPGKGTAKSSIWYPSIAAVEQAFNARYLGWSLDINYVLVAEWVPEPAGNISVGDLAAQAIRGDWGNGDDRRRRLTDAGYNYALVQQEVNRRLAGGGSPAPAPQRTYTVQRGDTLSKIGAKFGVKWQAIYDANRKAIGSDPNRIYSGLVLVIP